MFSPECLRWRLYQDPSAARAGSWGELTARLKSCPPGGAVSRQLSVAWETAGSTSYTSGRPGDRGGVFVVRQSAETLLMTKRRNRGRDAEKVRLHLPGLRGWPCGPFDR